MALMFNPSRLRIRNLVRTVGTNLGTSSVVLHLLNVNDTDFSAAIPSSSQATGYGTRTPSFRCGYCGPFLCQPLPNTWFGAPVEFYHPLPAFGVTVTPRPNHPYWRRSSGATPRREIKWLGINLYSSVLVHQRLINPIAIVAEHLIFSAEPMARYVKTQDDVALSVPDAIVMFPPRLRIGFVADHDKSLRDTETRSLKEKGPVPFSATS
jgi:hypothetical protein